MSIPVVSSEEEDPRHSICIKVCRGNRGMEFLCTISGYSVVYMRISDTAVNICVYGAAQSRILIHMPS